MKQDYRRSKTTVSLLNYHFVFCPRYRRKIFDIPRVEQRFKEMTIQTCESNDLKVLALECHHDHVHIFLSAPPTMSPADIMQVVKGASSKKLREEFPVLASMCSLWTRSYFVSTAGNVSSQTIQRYVETQKTRP